MDKIMTIAKKHGLYVIEDAAQAHGALFNGARVGSIGDLGCFSFYATKNMTTGEGGMVTTNSRKFANKLMALRNHGMIETNYKYNILGYNYCPTNIAAAMGIAQLKRLNNFNKQRVHNAKHYINNLSKIDGLILPSVPEASSHVFNQFTIRVSSTFPISRDKLMQMLEQEDINSRVYYPIPLHKQFLYRKLGYKECLPVSERASEEVLSLPVHPSVSLDHLNKIEQIIKNCIS